LGHNKLIGPFTSQEAGSLDAKILQPTIVGDKCGEIHNKLSILLSATIVVTQSARKSEWSVETYFKNRV
jgi:hypothetical protein